MNASKQRKKIESLLEEQKKKPVSALPVIPIIKVEDKHKEYQNISQLKAGTGKSVTIAVATDMGKAGHNYTKQSEDVNTWAENPNFKLHPSMPGFTSFGMKQRIKRGLINNLYNKISQ